MRLLWLLMSGINYLLLLLCSVLAVTGSSISPRTTDISGQTSEVSGQTSEASKTSVASKTTTASVGGTSTSNGKTIQLVTITPSTVSTLSTGPLPSDDGTTPSVTTGITLSANTLKTPFGATSRTQNSPEMNSTVLTGNTLSTLRSSITTVATRETQPSSTSSTDTLLTDNIVTTSAGVSVGTGTTIPGTKTTQLPEKQLLKSWEIILISLAVTAATIGGFIGCCYYCRTSSTSYSI